MAVVDDDEARMPWTKEFNSLGNLARESHYYAEDLDAFLYLMEISGMTLPVLKSALEYMGMRESTDFMAIELKDLELTLSDLTDHSQSDNLSKIQAARHAKPVFVKHGRGRKKSLRKWHRYPEDGQHLVYALFKGGSLMYIGKSKRVDTRLCQHRADKEFDQVYVTYVNSSLEASRLEAELIRELNPVLNYTPKTT